MYAYMLSSSTQTSVLFISLHVDLVDKGQSRIRLGVVAHSLQTHGQKGELLTQVNISYYVPMVFFLYSQPVAPVE